MLDRAVTFYEDQIPDPAFQDRDIVRGRFRIFEYRLSLGCFIEESEDCRVLGSESGATRIEDTFGKGVRSLPLTPSGTSLDRQLKSFLKISNPTTTSTKVEYVSDIFDGFGDGNLYWSKGKGYESSKRNMWGKYWGPGFYGWSLSRFSLIRTAGGTTGSDTRFVFSDFMDLAA